MTGEDHVVMMAKGNSNSKDIINSKNVNFNYVFLFETDFYLYFFGNIKKSDFYLYLESQTSTCVYSCYESWHSTGIEILAELLDSTNDLVQELAANSLASLAHTRAGRYPPPFAGL